VLKIGQCATIRAVTTPPSALISLDFDGTSVETDGKHFWFSELVAEGLNEAARRGAVWCTNSGRGPGSQIGMVQACRRLEAMPLAVLSGERHIHYLRSSGSALVPKQPYNDLATEKAKALIARVRERTQDQLSEMGAHFELADWNPQGEYLAWLLKDSGSVAAFVTRLEEALASIDQVQILRNGHWVVVTHSDFGKGVILEELAAEIQVPRDRILAIGDQQNDLDMLDGRVAAFVGCPADADPEVIKAVRDADGWVSDYNGAEGTADLLHRFVAQLPSP